MPNARPVAALGATPTCSRPASASSRRRTPVSQLSPRSSQTAAKPLQRSPAATAATGGERRQQTAPAAAAAEQQEQHGGTSSSLTTPAAVQQRRSPALAAAAVAALAAVGAGAYSTLSAQPSLPPLDALAPAAAALLGVPPLALLTAKAVLRDSFHAEWHRWVPPEGLRSCYQPCTPSRLSLCLPAPPRAPPCLHALPPVPPLYTPQGPAIRHRGRALGGAAGGGGGGGGAPRGRPAPGQRRVCGGAHQQGHMPRGIHGGAAGQGGLFPAISQRRGELHYSALGACSGSAPAVPAAAARPQTRRPQRRRPRPACTIGCRATLLPPLTTSGR